MIQENIKIQQDKIMKFIFFLGGIIGIAVFVIPSVFIAGIYYSIELFVVNVRKGIE